jgi:hypothetical protein
MNCYLHTDLEATAYCRSCGRPLCGSCQRIIAQGMVYCAEHAPAQTATCESARPIAQTDTGSPGLAFLLGLIPGVGAIYNRQYVKGLVHVIILGTLISILSSGAAHGFEPLFGLLTALWFPYMAFEAYHTASKRQRGEPVDEFSSLVPGRAHRAGSTAGPVAMIVLGVLFLVMTFRPEWAHQMFKLWPVVLILAGVYMLLARLKERAGGGTASKEVSHERQ